MAGECYRAIVGGAAALTTAAIAIILFILALLRWHENGWSALVWLLAFLAMCLIRTPHSVRNKANVVVEARVGGVEKVLLAAMFLTMMVLPLLELATGIFTFADYTIPNWASWLGAILQLPFLWLFWRSHTDLGRNWSPGLELRQDHGLITEGVYAHIRHPMYAAIWISALAQPLLVHNWIAGVLVIPAFAAMWILRVPEEEAMLQARFGKAWDEYCGRAGRLMPKSR